MNKKFLQYGKEVIPVKMIDENTLEFSSIRYVLKSGAKGTVYYQGKKTGEKVRIYTNKWDTTEGIGHYRETTEYSLDANGNIIETDIPSPEERELGDRRETTIAYFNPSNPHLRADQAREQQRAAEWMAGLMRERRSSRGGLSSEANPTPTLLLP